MFGLKYLALSPQTQQQIFCRLVKNYAFFAAKNMTVMIFSWKISVCVAQQDLCHCPICFPRTNKVVKVCQVLFLDSKQTGERLQGFY